MVQQIDRPFGLAGGDLGVKVRLGFSFGYVSHSSSLASPDNTDDTCVQ